MHVHKIGKWLLNEEILAAGEFIGFDDEFGDEEVAHMVALIYNSWYVGVVKADEVVDEK